MCWAMFGAASLEAYFQSTKPAYILIHYPLKNSQKSKTSIFK